MAKGKIGIQVTRLVQQHYPTLFQGDAEACAAAAVELADVLGGILAFAKVRAGEATWEATVKVIIKRIVDMQDRTIQRAEELAPTIHLPPDLRQ